MGDPGRPARGTQCGQAAVAPKAETAKYGPWVTQADGTWAVHGITHRSDKNTARSCEAWQLTGPQEAAGASPGQDWALVNRGHDGDHGDDKGVAST
jgi:hypothetical protein